jgi:hypothetical protein
MGGLDWSLGGVKRTGRKAILAVTVASFGLQLKEIAWGWQCRLQRSG